MRHANHPMYFQMVPSCEAVTVDGGEMRWAQIVEALTAKPLAVGKLTMSEYQCADRKTQRREKDGIAWMPVRIREGGHRCREHVEAVYALVLDFDQGTPFSFIRERLAGYEYVAHSTFSHTTVKPRCRVVLPLKCPILPEQQAGLFDLFNAKFDGMVDSASGRDPARIHFMPKCPVDAASMFESWHESGELLDYDREMAQGQLDEVVAAATAAAEVAALRGKLS